MVVANLFNITFPKVPRMGRLGSLHTSQVAHQAGAYPGFSVMSISTPPWMGCLAISGLPPALNSLVPIYTPGCREAMRR